MSETKKTVHVGARLGGRAADLFTTYQAKRCIQKTQALEEIIHLALAPDAMNRDTFAACTAAAAQTRAELAPDPSLSADVGARITAVWESLSEAQLLAVAAAAGVGDE